MASSVVKYQVMTAELVVEAQSQMEVWDLLMVAAIDRYFVLMSTLSIEGSIMESVDHRGNHEGGAEFLVA